MITDKTKARLYMKYLGETGPDCELSDCTLDWVSKVDRWYLLSYFLANPIQYKFIV